MTNGHPKDQSEGGFHRKFKSFEDYLEAELDAEEAQRQCTDARSVETNATASQGNPKSLMNTKTGTTPQNVPTAAPLTRRTDMSASPATIDITPLEDAFRSDRQVANARLEEISAITPQAMRDKTLSDQLIEQGEAEEWAELVAHVDTEAKRFLDAFKNDEKFNEQRRLIKALKDNFDDLCDRITNPAIAIRNRCQVLHNARLLAVNQRAEQERRALEREQQRIAEQERAEEVARLKDQAEQMKQAAAEARSAQEAADAEAEAARLAIAARDTAAAPVIPAAVPASTFQPPKTGISGTKVYFHTIEAWDQPKMIEGWQKFCAMLRTLVPSIRAEQNTTVVELPGFQMILNFTKLKKVKLPLVGMQVKEGMESRNMRR